MRIPVKKTAFYIPALVAVTVFLTFSHATLDGVVHTVREGDTLWEISRAYGACVEAIREANIPLRNTNMIRPGQRILIPGAKRIVETEPLTRQMREILRMGRSSRWEYIVIHHSATAGGNARIFEQNHRQRGFRTLGYHFVIANGTCNTSDGQVETGFRWRRQWDGAHTRGNANRVGIGICLVGNFENTPPTAKQMESLLLLSTHLAHRYGIPLENIKGHRDFAQNNTKCPGKKFPWDEFRNALIEQGIR